MEFKDSQSWQNIIKALQSEAMAYAQYTFFGQQARKDEYIQIADLFDETAANELHHAKLLFKKLHNDEVPHTLEGLQLAKEAEEKEGIEEYTAFAKTAKEEGYDELSEWFSKLADIEMAHKNRFQVLIDRVENDEVFKREDQKIWICTVCGHIHIGEEPPEECPVCHHPKGHFELKASNY